LPFSRQTIAPLVPERLHPPRKTRRRSTRAAGASARPTPAVVAIQDRDIVLCLRGENFLFGGAIGGKIGVAVKWSSVKFNNTAMRGETGRPTPAENC
jgi:hypothetical protein